MIIQVMTIFVVPLFQSMWRERVVIRNNIKEAQLINNEDNDENYTI
jgi:hypothetical protein